MLRQLVLLAVLALSLDKISGSVFHKEQCPKVSPMANIDMSRLNGVWYDYAASAGHLDPSQSCFKNTVTMKDAKTIQYLKEYFGSDLAYHNFTQTRDYDPSRPGVMSKKETITVEGMFGEKTQKEVVVDSIILYTDYDNVQLRYACTDLDNYWEAKTDKYFYVAVRNRNFDSVKQLLPLLGMAGQLGFSMDQVEFEYMGPNCKN